MGEEAQQGPSMDEMQRQQIPPGYGVVVSADGEYAAVAFDSVNSRQVDFVDDDEGEWWFPTYAEALAVAWADYEERERERAEGMYE